MWYRTVCIQAEREIIYNKEILQRKVLLRNHFCARGTLNNSKKIKNSIWYFSLALPPPQILGQPNT